MKVGIVTDTSSGISFEEAKKNGDIAYIFTIYN